MASSLKFATEKTAEHVEQQQPSSNDAPYEELDLPAFLTTADAATDQDVINRRVSASVPGFAQPSNDAKAATAIEHALTVREALRLYPKAVFWSMLLSLALVMDGYDKSLLTAFFGLPEFKRRFGKVADNGTYQVSTHWMAGLQNGAIIGEIVGLIASGVIYERYGYKKTMLGALIMIECSIFGLFFATNLRTLLVGEILCGLSWGVFQTQTTTYAAEVTPVCLRAYLTSYVNLCWVMGQFIGAGVVRGMVHKSLSQCVSLLGIILELVETEAYYSE